MKKIFSTAFIGIVALGLLGCETDNDNKIAEAQACLDAARSAGEGTACISKVDGIDSPQASLIRCAGTYIQRDFLTATFTQAYEKLKNPPAGKDATLAMVSYVAFNGASAVTGRAASADADYVVSECQKSGSGGLAWLAATTKVATVLGGLGTCTSGDIACFEGTLGNSASDADLGNAAIVAYDSYCSGGSAENSAACTEFAAAVEGGGDAAAIGAALRARLQTP